ncbi:MAG: YraN family protein [Candidatus Doudnabacteria bacterium]|nr:YraN family protein [Candidatus Doudnabacteria bacterium]
MPPDLSGMKTGEAGELWVAYLYQNKGFEILARNYAIYGKKKLGELDIVCRQGKRLVIVEVKTRTSEGFMDIVETLNFRKQAYLRRMAKLFVQANPRFENFDLQVDFAAVLMSLDNMVKSVKLIENVIEDTV